MADAFGYEFLPKAVVYLCGQIAVGLPILRWLCGTRHGQAPALDAWLRRASLTVALVLVIAVLVRAWAHTATAFGLAESWSLDQLQVIAVQSRWGRRWQLQLAAAVALLIGALLSFRHRSGRGLFLISAVALAVVMPRLGHAAGSTARMTVHTLHLLGSAAWIGTLGALAVAAARASAGGVNGTRGMSADLQRAIERFSPVALTTAAVVFVSGAVAATFYLASWSALWSTVYGRALLAKLALVALVAACGFRNWQRSRAGQPFDRGTLMLEYVCAVGVVAVTAALTETEHS